MPSEIKLSGRRLTKDIVKMGADFRKDISIKSYGGVDLTVRPLADKEMRLISMKLGYSLEDALGGVSLENLTEDEINLIRESGEVPASLAKKIGGSTFSDKFIAYMSEMCRVGIVPLTEDEDVGGMVDEFIAMASIQIGAAIMSVSYVKYDELIDFFARSKDTSSPPSLPQEQS